jgi:hypothetical protein
MVTAEHALAKDGPSRLQRLRMQVGRKSEVPATLTALLGGSRVRVGREREAMAIWESLRRRAQSGDAAASEDLSILTALLTEMASVREQPLLHRALFESVLDAAVLPRHRQEQLGRLCRLMASRGDRDDARRLLASMDTQADELEADSEYRVTAAVVATVDGDGERVLGLLGAQGATTPIADGVAPLALVLRANAYELAGNAPVAAQLLSGLPDAHALEIARLRYPSLRLCAQSGDAFLQRAALRAARRAATRAGGAMFVIGAILGTIGGIEAVVAIGALLTGGGWGAVVNLAIGGVLLALGVAIASRARRRGRRAAWLRIHGIPLSARVVEARPTGTTVNDVPLYRFALTVDGPDGPYPAAFKRLVREHEVAALLGEEVRVRADPNALSDVILED